MRLTWRLDAFYAFLCGGLLIVLFVSVRWYPDDPGDRPPAGQIAWRVLAGRGTLVAAGTGLYFLMIGAVWGYLEGIARGELVAAADRYGVEWGARRKSPRL
jgi:hypothetical protein